MKALKRIVIVIVVIIALALIAALFMKKNYAIEREVTINKPKADVFNYIKYLKNQNNYNVWNMTDPSEKRTYTGTDGTVGFVYGWDSQMNDIGKGDMQLTNVADGDRIDMLLHFERPFKAVDTVFMTTQSATPNQTTVKWGFRGRMAWPMNLMLPMLHMDKMLGDKLQEGLGNLKNNLEK